MTRKPEALPAISRAVERSDTPVSANNETHPSGIGLYAAKSPGIKRLNANLCLNSLAVSGV